MALPLLKQALKRGLPTELLHDETERVYALCLFATQHYVEAAQLFDRRVERLPSLAEQAEAMQWLKRSRWLDQRYE
ncbi:MAG: hypothetical protein IPJ88_07520 [Myxococcales bacterium]|nr:MAG: hypothetical protein IPJ88_07520 [Myxococcales bacterium]